MSSITFLDILGIIGGLIFGAAAFVYMFRYMPRVEEMTDLRNDNRRLEKENQELRDAASIAATERCEDAGLYAGKMMEMQRALLKQQQRSDEREAAHLREIERQREFIETISKAFNGKAINGSHEIRYDIFGNAIVPCRTTDTTGAAPRTPEVRIHALQ